MPDCRIKRALIAVYDKTGVAEFARSLVDEFGVEIISTGGTAKHLKEAGIPVTLVEDVTGFPEMLDGRVKTLHPKIHAAILADRDNPEHMRQLVEQGIEPIDMVVVNLYPFEKTVADPNCKFGDAIEMIDIGGPCLLRAAAKNHRHVLIADNVNLGSVLPVLRTGEHHGLTDEALREAAAIRVFQLTAGYDSRVAAWLSDCHDEPSAVPSTLLSALMSFQDLRYGENPHQAAKAMMQVGSHVDCETMIGLLRANQRATLSHNNYLDADAALGLCAELSRAMPGKEPRAEARGSFCCCFIKHTNPCGVGVADDPIEAYRRAYLSDPNAAMGGILAVDFPVTAGFAAAVMETYDRFGQPLKEAGAAFAPGGFFVEVWVAPSFTDEAIAIIRGTSRPGEAAPNPPKKKWGETVRLLAVGDMTRPPDPDELVYRSIAGGMLVQTPDLVGLNEEQWKAVTKRAPDDREMADLRLAWLIAKHTKSNAISLCRDGMLLGNGAGQMSRVMSCRIATWLARENGHAEKLPGSVAASDAFFPFSDGPLVLIDAGVTALLQPGGSKRDADTIAACNERGVAMIFTGTRHFRH